MKRILPAAVFCTVSLIASAQNKFTITGYVKDSLSGETLIGATVAINAKNNGIASNQYGFYSITLPANDYILSCSYVGYDSKQISISLQKNTEFNFLLSPKLSSGKEVIISSVRKDANVKNAQMGRVSLSIEQVKSLPVIFGEVDILKTLQLLPGVQNAGEGNIGLYVRGGGPDQNLILLDDA
ncbi:MAG TPA: carboxypeptidase-like regulatory domain-containing protein, partial [Puia sp.]|nr:carboxypeptidase-like regulatory domain-containing protein [Puia sp.]